MTSQDLTPEALAGFSAQLDGKPAHKACPHHPSLRYRQSAEHAGSKLALIGEWLDQAAYYEGSDGKAWTFHASTGRFSCDGDIATFRSNFSTRCRGSLFA